MATRYLRHYYVEYENQTEFITDTNASRTGKTHPPIRGLDVKYWGVDSAGIDYCLSVVNDDDSIIPTNSVGVEVLTFETWADRAEIFYNTILQDNSLQLVDFPLDKTSQESLETSFQRVYNHLFSLNSPNE